MPRRDGDITAHNNANVGYTRQMANFVPEDAAREPISRKQAQLGRKDARGTIAIQFPLRCGGCRSVIQVHTKVYASYRSIKDPDNPTGGYFLYTGTCPHRCGQELKFRTVPEIAGDPIAEADEAWRLVSGGEQLNLEMIRLRRQAKQAAIDERENETEMDRARRTAEDAKNRELKQRALKRMLENDYFEISPEALQSITKVDAITAAIADEGAGEEEKVAMEIAGDEFERRQAEKRRIALTEAPPAAATVAPLAVERPEKRARRAVVATGLDLGGSDDDE